MGLIGNINVNYKGTDMSDFEKGLYNLGTQELHKESSLLRRVDSLYNVILRGNNTYEEFLGVLKELNAPEDYDAFFIFFVKELYVDDDFYGMIAIIDDKKREFNGLHSGKVLEGIAKEIHTDYIKFKH